MAGAILTSAVALLHLWILVLEMVLWTRPTGRRAFGVSEEFANQTKVLAANQGLYNGFLAAGLAWSVWLGLPGAGRDTALFFLACVALAGAFGAATASRRILLIQTLPALAAAAAVLAGL